MKTIRKLKRRSSQSESEWQILDIGCGGGVAFEDLSNFGNVYGIEPDPHLSNAFPQYRDRIAQQPFDANFSPDGPFDLILMLDVLEHIEHDEDALIALRKILKPDGFAIITVPALMSLWSAHDEVNHHFRRYTAANLGTLLSSTGFRVHRLDYFFSWSLPLMYVRKLVAKKTDSAVQVPAKPINALFRSFTQFENLLRRFHVRFPLGSSLIAVISIDESFTAI